MKHMLIVITLTIISSAAFSQVYTWRDANGKIHYTDTPPPNVEVKKTDIKAPPPASGSDARARLAEQEAAFRKRREAASTAKSETEAEQKRAAEKAQACEDSREAVRTLESGRRVARTDEKGATSFVDDKQRTDMLKRAKQGIKEYCK